MPYDVVKKPCTMSDGKQGNAVIYKLTGDSREYVSCQVSEQVAYSVIARIEAGEKIDQRVNDISIKVHAK